MSKGEFMRQLEYLLSDIPTEDKKDALAYYEDYLEEAGDRAEQAILEFGSPERIAAIIRADLSGNLEDGGAFTERGYEDERFREPNYQMAKRYDLPEAQEGLGREEKDNGPQGESEGRQEGQGKESKPGGWKLFFLVVLFLAASPILLGLGSAAFGIIAGLGGGLLGLIVGLGALFLAAMVVLPVLTFALLLAGIAICIVGVLAMFSNFLNGLLCFGAGLVVFSIGLLLLLVSAWLYGKVIRVCVDGISRVVHRKGRVA